MKLLEESFLLNSEDNDGRLATHGKHKDRNDVEENLPSMETLEIKQNETVRSIPSYFGGENEKDIPDMADYEEADNVIETDAATLQLIYLVLKSLMMIMFL